MACDMYATVADCELCAKRDFKVTHERHLHLFPPSAPLKFIAVDIQGPFPRATKGSQYVVVVPDRYSKLTRAIPIAKTSAIQATKILFNHWLARYGMPRYFLTEKGPQFVAMILERLCCELKIKHFTTALCHPKANSQVDRCNKTLVAR